LLIFASSLSLCFEDINLQDNEELKFILKIVNLVFAVLFTVEMFLKWIAFGLYRYFSSVWTCLDFVIVIVSVLSLAVEGSSNLTAFRSLRTLRALRPLRAISRWQGMKIVVNALMYAIPSIINVLLVCLVFWLIFSIMGVQFFGGKFYKCLDEDNVRLPIDIVNDKWECAEKNFSWVNSKITFDHVGHAYLALFQVATFEGWMEIMADAVDARAVDLQPQYEASLYNYFYFVIFIVCGSFFTLNLFIGVIIDNFNALKKKYEGGVLEMFLTESQKHYYTAMKKLGRKKPQKVIKRPQNPYHALFYDISVSRRFEIAIFVLIFLNMVSMGIEHYDQSRAVTFVLEICNALFTTIFSLEATVKVIGLRHHYFTAAWNLFDFVLVIASIVGILMEDLMTDFPVSPTLLRVVRVFRIGRILRLIKAAKGIRKLLFALIVSLPALFNIGALLALITFIYAIIGMTIFGHVRHQGALDDLVNFETFGRSMQLLFRLVTSAGWNDVLDPLMAQPPDCDPDYKDLPNGNCGFPFVSIIYFVSFIIINFMIVINMYIAIILENFNQAHQEEEIGIVEEDLEMFYGKWSKFDPHATQFITFNQMSDFIGSLDPPLGIPKPNTLAIVSFDLPIAKGDKIHCLDVLHSLTKYTLGFIEDESEDFAKLTEQMDEKFKKQFPTRKELEIVSSTREWKRLDTAARCIQKFYRMYIRERTYGTFDERIDTETQTRRAIPAEDISPRSNPETDSRSLPQSDNLDTDFDQEFGSSQFPTGESLETTVDTNEEYNREESFEHNQYPEDIEGGEEYVEYEYEEDQKDEYVDNGVVLKNQQLEDQYQRQADVRHQLNQYARGAAGELLSESRGESFRTSPNVYARNDVANGKRHIEDGKDPRPPKNYNGQSHEYLGGRRNHPSAYQKGNHREFPVEHDDNRGATGRGVDYIRPVFPSKEVEDSLGFEIRAPRKGKGLIYESDIDHPHYHQYEDEICLKCDNDGLNQNPDLAGRTESDTLAPVLSQTQGCDYSIVSEDHQQGRPGEKTHPGYPAVSVQDFTQPGFVDTSYSDMEQSNTAPRKGSASPRYYPPGARKLPVSPGRYHGENIAFRQQQHPRFSYSGPEYNAERMPVQRRHPDSVSPNTLRRPVSDLSPRHLYPDRSPRHSSDQGSLPRRTLPEIPRQSHPETLPRVSRGHSKDSVENNRQNTSKRNFHQRTPEISQSRVERKEDLNQPSGSNIDATDRPTTERRSPKKSPLRRDDIKSSNLSSKTQRHDGGRSPGKPNRGTSHNPNRQTKTVSMTDPNPVSPKHKPGHSRTKSESGTRGGTKTKPSRHRVRRQSPVEERLSVHESDSMSDAFDDDGLFQIDENFAKFLDDKTSCQK